MLRLLWHNAAADFGQKRPNDLALKGWTDLVSDTVDQSAEVSPEMPDLLSSELTYLQNNWPADLPAGTIHADMFPDNVLFMDGKASGVIDFYFACHDMLAYDLAITMNSWCFDKNHDFCPAKANAMITAYDESRALSAAEKAAFPTLCRGGAFRFLLTRLYDWLNPVGDSVNPDKDPMHYVKRLAFHRRINDFSDYLG